MHATERLSHSGITTDLTDDDEPIPKQGSYTYTSPLPPHPPASSSPSSSAVAYPAIGHSQLYQSGIGPTTPPSPSAAHEPHTLNDDLLNLDSSPTLSLSIPDLDIFFTRVYDHWKDGGLRGVIGGRLVSLVVLAFSVSFSSFLLLFVDWHAIVDCGSHGALACEYVTVLTWQRVDEPEALTYIVALYFLVFFLYWLSHLLSFLYSLPSVLSIHSFYRSHLNLDDEAVVALTWSEVLQRLEAVQERERLCVVKRLNGLDITNRIMRRDNYMIALVNAQLLDVSPNWSWLCSFGRYEAIDERGEDGASKLQSSSWMYGTMLDSIVRLCVIDCLFSPDFRLSPSFTSPHAARSLRRRFLLFGLFTLVFLPFLVLFLVLLFVLRHAEELHTKKSLSSSRQWSLLSQWRLREYNELPHFFHRRLSLASQHASAYIEQFPSVLTSLLASAIAYCAAAVVGVLLLLGASGGVMSAYIWDRSLWWWLAAFSALLAISRSFIHTSPSASPTPTSPALTFASLVSYTHYHPRQWRGREHTVAVMRDVSAMYTSKLKLFAYEILALLACPFVLVALAQPERCERVVRYVQRVSVEVKGVGVVCQMARFELAADVQSDDTNVKDTPGQQANKQERADGHSAEKERVRGRARANRGREGKMEKSFLSFVINHQHWKLGAQDDDDDSSADKRRPTHHHSPHTTHGRDRFLLSIAESVKEADTVADQVKEQSPPQQTLEQRRTGRTRTESEYSGSGRQRRRRSSVDSLDSISSNESLSASPVRSRQSLVDDEYEEELKVPPTQSPSASVAPHTLSASDRNLLVSFADLLTVATHGAGSNATSRPWLAPTLLSSSVLTGSSAGLAGQRSMLANQLGGGIRAHQKRSAWEERMDEEMKASLSDRVREKMFAVLDQRVEEEDEADDDEHGARHEEAEEDTRLDGEDGVAGPRRLFGRRSAAAGDVEMRRILEPTQRLPQYHSITFS